MAAVGSPPVQTKRRDLTVLESPRRFGRAEPLPRDVAVRIEARGAQHANGDHFGPAAGRTRRHGFAAKIGDGRDAARRRRDDVRVVGIEDREAGDRHGTALERPAARDRVGERVGEHERDIRAPVADKLEVVDRGGGDFRRRAHVRQRLVEDLGEPTAVGIVDAAGAPSCDRKESGGRLAAVRAARAKKQNEYRERAGGGQTHAGDCRGSRLS